MSSGTYIKAEFEFKHFHCNSLDDCEEQLQDAIHKREIWKQRINALALATPKDITPQGEDNEPVGYVIGLLRDYWEMYEEADWRVFALNTIHENWNSKEDF